MSVEMIRVITSHLRHLYRGLEYTDMAISLLTLLGCVISWVLMPRWRTFKNYAFTSMVVAVVATYFFQTFERLPISLSDFLLGVYYLSKYICSNAVYNWLLVLCLCVYESLVPVHVEVTRKVNKSNLFAWGMPAVGTVLAMGLWTVGLTRSVETMLSYLQLTFLVMLLIVDILGFVSVLYGLQGSDCRAILLAIVTFVTSAVLFMLEIFLDPYSYDILKSIDKHDFETKHLIMALALVIQVFLKFFTKVFFMFVKSNRITGYEFNKFHAEKEDVLHVVKKDITGV